MTKLSREAGRVMHELIVLQGVSYAEAISQCERRAIQASAPYKEVATLLRAELAKAENGASPRSLANEVDRKGGDDG